MTDVAHAHRCRYTPEACAEGPCECVCGAVLEKGLSYRSDGLFAWHLPNGDWARFPDPNEANGIKDRAVRA